MKKELFYRICHAAAGCILMYHALHVLDAKDFFNAGLYLAAGLLFLTFAGIHEWIEKKWNKADVLIFALEAATLFYVASRYYKMDNTKIASVFAIVGVFFVLLMLSSLATKRRRQRRHKRKHRHEAENPKPHTGYKIMRDTNDV